MAIPVHSKPSAASRRPSRAAAPRRAAVQSPSAAIRSLWKPKANTEQKQLSGTCGRGQPDETWRPRPGPAPRPHPTAEPPLAVRPLHSMSRSHRPAPSRPRFFPRWRAPFPRAFFLHVRAKARSHDPPPSAAPRHAATRRDGRQPRPIYSHGAEACPLRVRPPRRNSSLG